MGNVESKRSKKHSKRRDAGLMYEFLVRAVSQALVDGNKKRSTRALKILKKAFAPGTELHRELRLINSLMKTTVSNQLTAASIMQEAKRAAQSHDSNKLDREKSLLIREVNHGLNDPNFYDQPIADYRMFATLQTLINDWRSVEPDLQRLAEYEDKLVEWLTSSKEQHVDPMLSDLTRGEQRLLVRTMVNKLNEKYGDKLNDSQRDVVRSLAQGGSSLNVKLESIRSNLVESIETYKVTHPEAYESQKLNEVAKKLTAENVTQCDDDVVGRFMMYAKLDEELREKE